MKLIQRFFQFMNPSIEKKVQSDIDRRNLHSIRNISLVVLFFEVVSLIVFLVSRLGRMDQGAMISLVSVCFCILLCASGFFIALRLLRKKDLQHSRFFLFKMVYFVAFTVWAIFVDYRHYKIGDQMLTFYAVDLVMACFIIFRPWIGTVLVGGSFLGLYIMLYSYNGAAKIQPFNFFVLALASIASNVIQCHVNINVSAKAIRLAENNAALESASRRDGLTGLQNRLALEEDALKTDGREMTAYMIDINYFKEINDQHGHIAGDAVLREVSDVLKRLFPGAQYYRYGGDEFLVLTCQSAEDNYGSDTFDFKQEDYGIRTFLSIGKAQGSPQSYQEVFELISRADKALYVTKQRTHSAEFGGHDRRQRRS